ncbi:MAG: hypothetical protein WCV70_02635 [Patescibacteria group bacterium]|jgi:hypothetical protein
MSSLTIKLLALALIIIGEAVMIYAEISGAKIYSGNFTFQQAFLKSIAAIFIGGAILLSGYIMGYRGFKNIWIVSAVSVTSILVIEPVLNYLIFQQLPTKGALIGLILGIIGFISALFI